MGDDDEKGNFMNVKVQKIAALSPNYKQVSFYVISFFLFCIRFVGPRFVVDASVCTAPRGENILTGADQPTAKCKNHF